MSHTSHQSHLQQTLRTLALGVVLAVTFSLASAQPVEAAATVNGLAAKSTTAKDATIAWSPYTGAAKYRIYWSTSPSMPSTCEPTCQVVTPASPSSPSVALSKVMTPVTGKTYYVKISAINSANRTITGWQTTALKIQLADPIPKTVGGITATSITASDATISWDTVPTATKYRIYARTTNSFPSTCEPHCWVTTPTVSGSRASIKLSDVLNTQSGATYYLKISAINSANRTITGWQTTAVPFTLASDTEIPSTVEGIAASDISESDATLSWNVVPTAASYRVYIRTDSSFPYACEPNCWVVEPEISGSTASIRLSDVIQPLSGTTYYVKISASNASGKLLTGWQDKPFSFKTDGKAVVLDVSTVNTTAIDTRVQWKQLDGAVRYRIYWSTSSSMPFSCEPTCAVIIPSNAARPSVSLSSLAPVDPGQTYYLKVSGINAAGKTISGWQPTPTKVTLASGSKSAVPTQLKLTADGPASITATWTSDRGAPAHLVELTGPKTRTIRTTERQATFSGLAPGASYSVRVRTTESDGSGLSNWTSPAQIVTPTSGVRPLRVGSYNVRCANCLTDEIDRSIDELPWRERRLAVADVLVSRNPAVVGVQEASQGWLHTPAGDLINRSQFEDLSLATKELGHEYKLTNGHRNNCVKSTTPTGCVYKDQGASKGTRILYDPQQVSLLRSGSVELSHATSSSNVRFLAWAEFSRNDTGERFIFFDTHLEPGSTPALSAARAGQAAEVAQAMATINSSKLPAVLVGDMNSTRYFVPNSPFDAFTADGWIEPLGHTPGSPKIAPTATVESRMNANYNSYNGFNRAQRRYATTENGSNLDYIFTTPMRVKRWEAVVRLDSAGNLVETIPSDHNALVADLIFP